MYWASVEALFGKIWQMRRNTVSICTACGGAAIVWLNRCRCWMALRLRGICCHRSGRYFYTPVWIQQTLKHTLRLLSAGAQPPFVVLAETQRAGRGRRGRKWISARRPESLLQLGLQNYGWLSAALGLSLVAGLAVMVSLRNLGVRQAGLKWPNDVYAGGKKLAGVLLELSGDPADVCHVVVGIGINVNMVSTKEQIDQPWTSIRAELGHLIDRNLVVTCLSDILHRYLQRHTDYGFASLFGRNGSASVNLTS
ncbi:Bifunctional ligase/repressor BirA [Stutzerimonas stutzeri]